MRRIVAVVLMTLFLFQALEVAYIYVNFKINQTRIAETLCINKNKPELNCNGCCQLKKELKEQKEREEQKEDFVFPEKTIVYTNLNWTVSIGYYPTINILKFAQKESFYIQNGVHGIFHPPQC